jgi:hypothetical protein
MRQAGHSCLVLLDIALIVATGLPRYMRACDRDTCLCERYEVTGERSPKSQASAERIAAAAS